MCFVKLAAADLFSVIWRTPDEDAMSLLLRSLRRFSRRCMAASAARDSEKIGFPPFTVNNARNGKNTLYIQSIMTMTFAFFGMKKKQQQRVMPITSSCMHACPSLVPRFGTKLQKQRKVLLLHYLPTYLPSVCENSNNLVVCHQSIQNYIQHSRMTAGNAGVIRVEEQMSTDMDGETASGAGPASSTQRRKTRRRRRRTTTTGSNRRRACHGSSASPCSLFYFPSCSNVLYGVAGAMAAGTVGVEGTDREREG